MYTIYALIDPYVLVLLSPLGLSLLLFLFVGIKDLVLWMMNREKKGNHHGK